MCGNCDYVRQLGKDNTLLCTKHGAERPQDVTEILVVGMYTRNTDRKAGRTGIMKTTYPDKRRKGPFTPASFGEAVRVVTNNYIVTGACRVE